MAHSTEIESLIVRQLAEREMGILSLVVAVRRTSYGSKGLKGDLTTMVKSALKTLVASEAVVDDDGMFSLASPA